MCKSDPDSNILQNPRALYFDDASKSKPWNGTYVLAHRFENLEYLKGSGGLRV